MDGRRGRACAANSWPCRGSWAGPGPQVLGQCRLTHAEVAPAEGTGRAGAGAGWRVSPHGLCEGAKAGAGIDGGALRRLPKPCTRASPLRLPWKPRELTRGRRHRSGARGLSQGPPFHSRVRFACVTGEGAGVRGGQDKRDRGELLPESVARPPVRGHARSGRPSRPGFGGVQPGVRV